MDHDVITITRTPKRSRGRAAGSFITRYKAKSVIFEEGYAGGPWRILSGAVVFETLIEGEYRFAGLALPNDLIGYEARFEGCVQFRARTMLPTQLMRWQPDTGPVWDHQEIMQQLVRQSQRTSELMALRHGSAQERVVRLIRLFSATHTAAGALLPTLKDMSLMSGLAGESICREMSRLRDEGRLVSREKRHVLQDIPCAALIH